MPGNNPDYGLTTRQVMERIAVNDPDTVYAMYRAGKISGNKIGREYRFSARSVEQFLSGEKASSREPPAPRRRASKPGAWRRGVEQILRA